MNIPAPYSYLKIALPSWDKPGGDKKALFAVSAVFLLGLSLFALAGAVFSASGLHVPRRVGPKPSKAQAVQMLARDGAPLKGWWFAAEAWNRACVIVLHGIGDSKAGGSGFAPLFLASGYSVLSPDSRAHGESGGEFVTYGLLERNDVAGWAEWMKMRGCQKLYGLGESLGGAVLIQATAVTPLFRAIVAECPYATLRRIAEYRTRERIPLPPVLATAAASTLVEAGMLYAQLVHGLDVSGVSPAESLRRSSTPLLLIHGLDDSKTPPEESRRLYAARPRNTCLWLVPGAGHTNASAVAPVEFRRRVLGWFKEH